ncbi:MULTISPECIES: alpha/beta fold hydrolase [unclassified Streptomyces]|uniref:alpha/beta fold hydrolase n=1 Tax=unclassified Streptomyces TaxID=2593676 RepID=UPI002DDC2851|nr:hypothetical protein [Streptomyces sp. NBC_01257]WRZ62446.1 alpha/beta hydrolase [Streptomyces sp. NBC_01257]WSU56416.1 alpha/beta hydrolase [Streptomyces sp. NBC_01104]
MRPGFTIVCPYLRGYGRSRGPAPAPAHVPHSKRALAEAMAAVMRRLDTSASGSSVTTAGAAVALRLVLDHPSR